MNDTSIVTRSNSRASGGKCIGRQVTRVRPFEDDHSRIAAQPPVELAVADVERDDARGAVPQQDVGEAPGRGADVERRAACDGDAEGVERMVQLEPAAADVGMIGDEERDGGVDADRRARLGCRLAVDAHLAGEDERARAFARRRQSPLDEQRVEAKGLLQLVRSTAAADHPVGDGRQLTTELHGGERGARAVGAVGGEPSGFGEPEQCRIGRLARRGILAGGLPQIGRGAFDVEDVVDDLKRQAERLAVGVDRGFLRR